MLAFVLWRHVSSLAQSFVDIPYRDSWQLIAGDSFKLSWLLRPHNEHFIFLSKLQVLLFYKLSFWNVELQLWSNLFIYVLALFALFSLFKDKVLIALVFGLCNLNWENLSWEFQSCFHFFILFSVLTVIGIKNKNYFLAILSNLCLVLSFSAGVGAALVFSFISLRSNKKLALFLFLPCLLYVFNGKSGAALVLPNDQRFWDFFLNLVSLGFGFETYSWILGLSCLALVTTPIDFHKIFSKDENRKEFSAASVLALAILASLAIIAMGRAGNADLNIWSKGSRYFEIASLLVPCGLVLWTEFLAKYLSEKNSIIWGYVFLILPLIGTYNNWDYSIYSWIAQQKTIGRECVRNYAQGNHANSEIFCKTLWAGESSKQIAIAKELKLSFIR